MTPIILGQIHGTTKKLSLDLNILLRTRLLIQANSGGGKSWVIRLLAEKLFGRIPVIILDPEGEFPTLREKYGYVLVGKGGETPADTRSAGLVAHKLLELRASAVCDLYEMKPGDRHRWVRLFLESVIDAPKSLWRPTVFIVDEAHVFCPEKGFGESEASEAMVGLPTRGRKRRFCTIFATQRLGKLRKDASAELLNRLVGPTFEDVDLKRAAELLSIRSEDRREFDKQMRVLEPGYFFALGRAITKERLLVRIGAVETSHEIEEAKYGGEPPPPPEKVRALLPKLADLPKQAEEKARTEAELSGVIRSLRAQLAARPKETVEKSIEKRVEVPVLKEAQIKRIEVSLTRVEKCKGSILHNLQALDAVRAALGQAASEIMRAVNAVNGSQAPPETIHLPIRGTITAHRRSVEPPSKQARPAPSGDGSKLSRPNQRILDELAELEAIGVSPASKVQLALLCGYTNPKSGGFSEPLRELIVGSLITYPQGGFVELTDGGRAVAHPVARPLTTEELQGRILSKLDGPRANVLRELIPIYPESMEKTVLAERLGYTNPKSGGFSEPLASLKALRLVGYPSRGQIVAQPLLFLEPSP